MEEDILKELFEEQELQALNDKEPKKGHQKRFAKKLSKHSRGTRRIPFLRIAVAIAVLLSVYSVGTLAQPDETQLEIASFSQYFNTIIEEKTNGLEQFKTEAQRMMILDALTAIEELEKDAQLLYEDLNKGGAPELLIKALTDNYNTRITVLDQLLTDLNDTKQ